MRVVYISYEEAQQLIPVFEYIKRYGPHKDSRVDSDALLKELRMVRSNTDYEPMGGRQLWLTERLYEALEAARSES